jgi:hypothetical protein
MTKGGIIENVLKEMRSARSRKKRRPAEDDKEEQEVIDHLEKLLRGAEPDTEILSCADFIELNGECCPTCHHYMFPFDMCSVTKLKNGEYAWICCAMKSAITRASGGEISVKIKPSEAPAKPAGYKPFADFFGGKLVDDGK